MRGNHFGKMFSLTTFGESHGAAIGVVVDGVPAGLSFSMEDLQKELDRRAPGKIPGTTSRKESDSPEILSGIFEGKTLGTPIAVMVRNQNQRSQDYDKLKDSYRPGHADKTTSIKYGFRDHRGGGRSSGRETLSRVIAGYFASLIVPKVKIRAFISKLGPFSLAEEFPENLPEDLGEYSYPEKEKWDDFLPGYTMGEDVEISYRISKNWTLVQSPEALLYHKKSEDSRDARPERIAVIFPSISTILNFPE